MEHGRPSMGVNDEKGAARPGKPASGRGIRAILAVAVLAGLFVFPGASYAARTVNSATLDGAASVTVASGATIAAVVNVTTTGGGSAGRWRSTGWLISTAPGTVACVDHPNHDGAGTYSEAFSITAPASTGTYNAYFIAYDNNSCSSGASATFTMTSAVTVDATPPAVSSITLVNPSPTGAASVSWTVTFSESVTGVDATDFALVQAGGVSGASITSVTGSGTTWTVTASTGTGDGTLGLNLVDDDSIVDAVGNPLGGAGAGNGNFTGEVYTVTKAAVVINTYYPGMANAGAGATSITLGAATGAAVPIAAGDLVLIIQMQDASIDSTNTSAYGDGAAGDPGSGATTPGNSGLYEYAVAANAVPLGGGTLTLSCGTINAYTDAAATSSRGQRRFQVIRVPVFASYTLGAITAQAWNGGTGGVLAFDVTGVLSLNAATVSVDGLGFRGGAARQLAGGSGSSTDYRTLATNNANGSKGEGIAGTPRYVFTAPTTLTNTGVEGYPNGSSARGAPGNAGGGGTDGNPAANDQNTGGGGGANGGGGGQGGISWCPGFSAASPPNYGCSNTGGFGGAAVGLGAARLTPGGGGGSATTNNGTGALASGLSSSGAAGGGMVMIRAGSLTGTATFNANGSNADSSVRNDGGGGGGAGGAVLISAGSGMGGVTINVRGGAGGSNLVPPGSTATPHGPGGGGGGGYAITSAAPASCNAGGGANGVSYNNGVLFGAYGTTPGSPGSCASTLTSGQIPGAGLGPIVSCVDHFMVSHGGTGVNCQAVNVTFTAHNLSHAPVTLGSGISIGISTSTNHGDWSLASGSGVLTNYGNGSAIYVSGAESSFVLALKDTFAETTNINVVSGTATERSGTASADVPFDPDLAFAQSGFRFVDSAGVATIPTQTAGQTSGTYYLQAILAGTGTAACAGAFGGQTVNVNLASQCNNPTTCAGVQVNFTNNSITTALASNPNAGVSSYTTVPVTFLNDGTSRAPFTINYADVGAISLYARYNIPLGGGGGSGNLMVGSSNPFVVKPYSFALSNIKRTSDSFANPGAASASGPAFIKAGQAFTATVTAIALGGTATPNYGREATPEGVLLTPALVLPSGGNNPALSNGMIPGTEFGAGGMVATDPDGVATVTNLSWGEVGILTLTPSVGDGNYLGAGDVTGTASGNIGRFYPDHFSLAAPSITNRSDLSCSPASSFTYMDEPMSVAFTLSAQNASNGTTQNYASSNGFAKLNPGTPSSFGFGAINNAATKTPLTARLNPIASSGSWASGTAAVTASVALLRAATPDGPYESLAIGAAPQDSDGVALQPAGLNLDVDNNSVNDHALLGSTSARFGRLRLWNAHGSDLLGLPVPMQTQYWDSGVSNFRTNAADNCTQIAAGNITFGNYTKNLASAEMGASHIILGGLFSAGIGSLSLTKPSGGDGRYDGSVDLTVDLAAAGMSYLQGAWTGSTYTENPKARATFGIYKGGPVIYMRENY